jgi:hypothetical protein
MLALLAARRPPSTTKQLGSRWGLLMLPALLTPGRPPRVLLSWEPLYATSSHVSCGNEGCVIGLSRGLLLQPVLLAGWLALLAGLVCCLYAFRRRCVCARALCKRNSSLVWCSRGSSCGK